MRFCQLRLMAVAGSAPHLSAAAASACTQRELLGVTDHLQATCGGRSDSISGEDIFQALPRMEVANALAGVRKADDARQVALLAGAVAGSRPQFRPIADPSAHPPVEVLARPP